MCSYSEHAYRSGQFGEWLSPIRSEVNCYSPEETPHIMPLDDSRLGFDFQWFGLEIAVVVLLVALIALSKRYLPSSGRFKSARSGLTHDA